MRDEKIQEELERLILSSYEAMYRVAFTYMRNEQDSMDVVQDSIVKAMKSVSQVRESSFLKTWLFRIVMNTALSELERRKKILPLIPGAEEGQEDHYEDTDIKNVLNQLDETEKKVVILRYFEEWKLEDIAVFLEMNLNTVKSVLYRSLKKLRTELAKGDAVS